MKKPTCEDCQFFKCYGWHSYGCEKYSATMPSAASPHDDVCDDFIAE